MTELEIHLLGIDPAVMRPLVVLREKTGDHRLLPIWVGGAEALAIARPSDAGQDDEVPRPMIYELLGRVIAALGHEVEEIRVCAVRDGAFLAELRFDTGVCVSCRAGDAVALALNLGLPICACDDVLAEAAIPEAAVISASPSGEVEDEDEVERFREFLDTVEPEDFVMAEDETSPDRIRKRVVVAGTVQGVFFRDSCRDVARRHSVAGWVTNRGDGSVEAVFEGAPDDVNTLVEWAGVGPARADVRTVEVVEEPPEGLDGFSVRRG